jgi:hypothetical protein
MGTVGFARKRAPDLEIAGFDKVPHRQFRDSSRHIPQCNKAANA